ncbi:MAG: glycosyltransferase family 2 protein [Phycisphaerales bacterium]|nr:glycosyltransferase family 2 protein [Phycisphaerales bacterium]
MPTLSVILITKNEEVDLPACLKSVAFADEIIIVDNGSTDRTPEIAQEFGAKFFTEKWHGFGPQKNLSLSKATCDWVFSIDADEVVPEKLANEIKKTIENPVYCGYDISRTTTFCGKKVRFGDWGRDKVLRLFRRGSGSFTNDQLHERVVVTGVVGKLNCSMIHNSISSIEDAKEKMVSYATISAKERKGSMLKAITRGFWTFYRSYILRFGWLDGWSGYQIARLSAKGTYLRYTLAKKK